jgi:3-oxoacyl-[acyl-carrier protein] reductase
MSTFIFAGASSKIAIAAASMLRSEHHRVIGISTKESTGAYDEHHTVSSYDFGNFPAIEGPVNGLVYFPGTIQLKPFHRFTSEEFHRDLQINTLGAVAFVQHYLPQLKQSKNGSITFITTVATKVGMPFHSSISMAKGALEGLSLALAAELAPDIRVNCIAPSLTATPLSEKFVGTPEKLEASQKRNPMKKVGNPEDIANMIVFLMSDKAAWITGQSFSVDGGMKNIKNL